jgi:hypothetical protein
MGRRSRKRESSEARAAGTATGRADVAPAQRTPAARPRRRPRWEDAPPPPWGGFPLVELCTLLAIGVGIWGFTEGGRSGTVKIAAAAALGSLAGLELSIREHLAGFRSHSTVLAGVVAIVVSAILYFVYAPRGVIAAVAVAVFGCAFFAFRGLFKRRSGGFSFR